jgi:mannose-6-phosphate isomerase-like protein (cupin superfamily)
MNERDGRYRSFVLGQEMRVTILTSGRETEGRHDVTEAVQEPGTMTPLHLHTRYDERLWVIDGELTVWAGDDKLSVGPGGFVTIRRNTAHMIQAGPHGARALNISSPAGFAELIERTAVPAKSAGPEGRMDLALFMEVSTALGDVVLGPPGTTPDQLDAPRVTRLQELEALHVRRSVSGA